jgi:hypothetical protein
VEQLILDARDTSRFKWSIAAETLTRPYPISISVAIPLIVLLLLVPCYIFIGELMTPDLTLHMPEFALDRAMLLHPTWSLIYGSLYVFVLLPLLIVRQQEQIRRTVWAYLMVWIVAYVSFLVYPTIAPRPNNVIGADFSAWMLRIITPVTRPIIAFLLFTSRTLSYQR